MSGTVLVTGASGFVAQHCILKLLDAGYGVRATLRSPGRQQEVRAALARGGARPDAPIEFVDLDLMSDRGWPEAAAGCRYMLHVASPLPPGIPRHEDDLIIPARDGALRALRAARDAGVERVVLTSSFAAIGYGAPPADNFYTEESWTDTSRKLAAYTKSKAIAERAAWDFGAGEGRGMEIAVINPVVIFGPALTSDLSASTLLIKRMLDGRVPGLPRLMIGGVDARDVADLHLLAMTSPRASGHRFLCTSGEFMRLNQVAHMLRDGMGARGARVTTRELPDWAVRAGALFSPLLRQTVSELGKIKQASHRKATDMLGWRPRPPQEAVLATARSLVDLGLA